MTKAKIVQGDNELLQFVQSLGGVDTVHEIVQNASGWWVILYESEDDPAQVIIREESGLFGFSYGVADDLNTAGTAVSQRVRISSLRTTIAAEALDAGGNQAVTGTLVHTYVMPGSVTLSDAGGTAFDVVDNEQGVLVNATRRTQEVGTINYSTGDFAVSYPQTAIPSGAVTGAYDYSTLPDSAEFPRGCEVMRTILKMTAGAGANVTWYLYEDEAMAFPAVATGSLAIASGQTKYIDINQVTHTKDLVDRDARWLRIVPDAGANNDYQVHMYWQRRSTT